MPCTVSRRAAASRVDAASARTASTSAKRTTLVAVLTVALVAATVAPAAAAGRGKRHTVRKGDTLSLLAIEHGMDKRKGWRRLYNANPRVADPNLIERGTRLYIPRYGERVERRRLPSRRDVASRASRGAAGSAPTRGVWARLAACESSGNWAANTGNGYYGGLQFSRASWRAVGGRGYPHRASPARQIAMAKRLLARQGWSAWPGCSRKLGLR